MSIPVSAIIMTKDEEANIVKCLDALASFDEVFVVDSGSTDRTCELAEAKGATVVEFRWNGGYPKKKQWCLENLPFRNEWALYVDADEIVTPPLAEEIGRVVQDSPHTGWFVHYDYVFLDRVLRHGHTVWKLVLLKPGKAAFAQLDDLASENAGEVELHYQPTIDGSVGHLEHAMVHDDHDTLFHYFARHNRYSDWEAIVRSNESLRRSGESQSRARVLMKRAFDRMPFKGAIAFFHSWLWLRGFRDGRAGFHYALSRAFYYWQIALKQDELRRRRGGAR